MAQFNRFILARRYFGAKRRILHITVEPTREEAPSLRALAYDVRGSILHYIMQMIADNTMRSFHGIAISGPMKLTTMFYLIANLKNLLAKEYRDIFIAFYNPEAGSYLIDTEVDGGILLAPSDLGSDEHLVTC